MLTTITPTVSQVLSLAVAQEVMHSRFGDCAFILFAVYPEKGSRLRPWTHFVFLGEEGECTVSVRLGMEAGRIECWDGRIWLFGPEWREKGEFQMAKCVGEGKEEPFQVSFGVFSSVPAGGMYGIKIPAHLNETL